MNTEAHEPQTPASLEVASVPAHGGCDAKRHTTQAAPFAGDAGVVGSSDRSPRLGAGGGVGGVKPRRVLVACEYSGTVRDWLTILGHDAWSCDLLPSDKPGKHYQCDVREVIGLGWDDLIGFPDCTYVCGSGLHWNDRGRGWEKTEEAVKFFRFLWEQPFERICLENPVGILSTRVCPPNQYIQPYFFGHDASKKTGLWLKGFPLLRKTRYVEPRLVKGRERWGNQTDSGQNKLPPSPDRWKLRARTYSGIAEAMANQWFGKAK